ncbi:MAG TPA: DNA translocase FtsK 4TM domain-containing protein [Myxococcota bacterium]|nr:DNA translocase FtsK 4TM domain-containing protein [Myxococcota bacterium]
MAPSTTTLRTDRTDRSTRLREPEAERRERDPIIRLEIYGILVLSFAVALTLALLSFDAADVGGGGRVGKTANLLGPIGAHIADMFLAGIGIGSFGVALVFGWLGTSYLIGRRGRMQRLDVLGATCGLVSLTVLAHVIATPMRLLEHPPGGALGALIGEVSSSLLSGPGTFLAFTALGVVALVLLTRRSIFELAATVGRASKTTGKVIARAVKLGDNEAGTSARRERAEKNDKAERAPNPRPEGEREDARARADEAPRAGAKKVERAEKADKRAERAARVEPSQAKEEGVEAEAETTAAELEVDDGPRIAERRHRPVPMAAASEAPIEDAWDEEETEDGEEDPEALEGDDEGEVDGWDEEADDAEGEEGEDEDDADADIKIVESAAMKRTRELSPEAIEAMTAAQISLPVAEEKPFVLPSLSMLDYRPPETTSYDRDLLKRNAQILESKLLDYKVKGKVVEIHPGPVITMYEFMPAPGVKVSAIANLANDLAMALSAISIRIVAPIPGKNVVGIEIPNAARETVWLKEILSDGSYSRAKSKLTLALGKDIVGNPTCMDLGKAPHLLVAGATGAGKSVAINSFVVSLLFKAEPSDVRVIMVDPKMLELSIYEGIPHLLLPVVTDPKQAATALKWAVKEMERRYRLMADMGVRNLAGFNQKVAQLHEDPTQRLPEKLRMARLLREAKGQVDPKGSVLDADGKPLERLPSIVVIIDELADLMMVASKEVEHCIARLAQMARASGIHLILATQRPSVDVITGLIKANFPTRISFRVASQIDSRTILDHKGAEALLGMGDMLFLPPGAAMQRVHGCYVSEDEVHAVVAHLKEQGSPEYDMGILTSDDEDGDSGPAPVDGDGDDLYNQAVRIAAEARYISTSYLQRKLKIGYNRSARIIEQMEENGIIGPSDGTSRPREVFIDPL